MVARGVCMVAGGICMVARGGVCVVVGGMHKIRPDTVNEWAVRILLECILVTKSNKLKNVRIFYSFILLVKS